MDAGDDVMELTVGEVQVQVRRAAPFTATEHARGAAMAELVSDVLGRERAPAGAPRRAGSARAGCPSYVVRGRTVSAVVDDQVVGVATVRPGAVDEPEPAPPTSRSTRPGGAAASAPGCCRRRPGVAQHDGAAEIVLTARADNQAVLPMVLAAGMRGRIRMAGDTLTVRIGLRGIGR